MVPLKVEITNKITKQQWNEVIKLATRMYVASPSRLRWGQCIFNALSDLYPYTSDEVRNTEVDPFYIEDRIEHMRNSIIE